MPKNQEEGEEEGEEEEEEEEESMQGYIGGGDVPYILDIKRCLPWERGRKGLPLDLRMGSDWLACLRYRRGNFPGPRRPPPSQSPCIHIRAPPSQSPLRLFALFANRCKSTPERCYADRTPTFRPPAHDDTYSRPSLTTGQPVGGFASACNWRGGISKGYIHFHRALS